MAARASSRFALAALAVLVPGCGGRDQPDTVRNDTQRQAEQIAKQAEAITRQAENGTAAIEQALENEGAIIFENRENLLNEVATNEANAAQPK